MTIYPNEHSPTTGPAVAFDAAALPSWLAQPAARGTTRAEALGINDSFNHAPGPLRGLVDLLAALREDPRQTVWRLQPGVIHVGVTHAGVAHAGLAHGGDGERRDGVRIVVDLSHQLRLAGPQRDPREFTGSNTGGTPAAVEALGSLAAQANTILGAYRGGQPTDRQLHVYHLNEVQYRGLEKALELPEHGLRPRTAWPTPDDVHLSTRYEFNDCDLDTAIAYARGAGLAHRETHEIYIPGPTSPTGDSGPP